MKNKSRVGGVITALLLAFSSLAANLSQAQTPSLTIVNGVTCTSAQAVTFTYLAGTMTINTGGCGTVSAPPSISSVTPTTGPAGTPVTINGANLAGANVTIGGLAASVSNNTGTVITTSVPATATAASVGGVVVTVAGLATAPFDFTVQNPPPAAAPSITSVLPTSGTAGTTVAITGTSLSGATVLIGGLAATVTSNTGTVITTSVPATATAASVGGIVVTVGSFEPAKSPFTVLAPPAPTITAVSPASGVVGSQVTISGTGLTGATVTIGGANATIVTSSATSITTTVPAGAASGAGFVVVTAPGQMPISSPFTVTAAPAGGDVSIEGVTLPNPSKSAFVPGPGHAGANGAGPEVNAWAMPPSRCLTTTAAPLTRSWQHNINLEDYKSKNAFDFFALRTNEALSYRFTLGSVPETGGFVYNDATNATVAPTVMSITSAPCQFDTSKLVSGPTFDACVQTGINGNVINYASITGPTPPAYCRLQVGQTYYFNIRFQDGRVGNTATDSCLGGNCGGFIQMFK